MLDLGVDDRVQPVGRATLRQRPNDRGKIAGRAAEPEAGGAEGAQRRRAVAGPVCIGNGCGGFAQARLGHVVPECLCIFAVEHHEWCPCRTGEQRLHLTGRDAEPIREVRRADPKALEDPGHWRRPALNGLASHRRVGGRRREVSGLTPVPERELGASCRLERQENVAPRIEGRDGGGEGFGGGGHWTPQREGGRSAGMRSATGPSGKSSRRSSTAVSRRIPATSGENGAGWP